MVCSITMVLKTLERVIIAMGSVTEAAREAIDYLMSKGEKVGLVLYIIPSVLC